MCVWCKMQHVIEIEINMDLDWKSLFNKDTKYHRPRSNDIFYRKHSNKKGKR